MIKCKVFLKESGRGLILRYYPGIRMEGLRKTTINLSHDSRSLGPDLNLKPHEYKAGVLTTRPGRSVCRDSRAYMACKKILYFQREQCTKTCTFSQARHCCK
jgi:hypothetical protein